MRSFEAIKQKLQDHLPELRKKYPIGEIAFFGSVTRDDFNEQESDVDILIDFNSADFNTFFLLATDLESLLERKVDLVTKRSLKARHWNYLRHKLVYV